MSGQKRAKPAKLVVFIIILALFIPCVFSVNQKYWYDGTSLSASAESVSPYPVEPGQDFTVQLRVYNDGGEQAEDVTVDFLKSDVFFLTGKDDDFDSPFSLCGGCSKDNMFYFTVLPGTKSGEYPIIFKIQEGSIVQESKVFFRVIGEPDVIFDANLLTENIHPDSSFDVNLTMINAGTGIARNIKVVPITDGFVMDNSNLIFIEELKPEETYKTKTTFMVADDLNTEPYRVKFKVDYKDEKSEAYSLEQSLGVNLQSKVELNIEAVKIEPQLLTVGKETIITVRVENVGEGKAEGIQVILENDGFDGQNKAFIGKLEENEDAPGVITFIPTKAGKHDSKVIVTYKDSLGEHKIEEDIVLFVQAKDYMWKFIALGIIFIILGTLEYYDMKRKNMQ